MLLDESHISSSNDHLQETAIEEPARKVAITELFIVREFKISDRSLLFKACTEADHLVHWWGGGAAPITVDCLELERGGKFIFHSNGVPNSYNTIKFRSINSDNQLSFYCGFSDENGEFIRSPANPSFPMWMDYDWIFKTVYEVGFTNAKVVLEIRTWPCNANPQEMKCFSDVADDITNGWNASFDRLENYLATI